MSIFCIDIVFGEISGSDIRLARWDGRSTGEWVKEIDGAEAIVNLAGGKLCQLYVSPQGALTIARAGGTGFVFCIREQMASGESEEFLSELAKTQTG